MGQYIKVPLTTLVRVKKIVTCFKDRPQPTYAAVPESHDFWELVFLESGKMIATAGDRNVEMRAGDLIFHAPDTPHTLRGNGKDAFSFFIVTFDCDSVAMQSLAGHTCSAPPGGAELLERIYLERSRALGGQHVDLSVREDAPLGGLQMIQLYLEQFLIGVLRAEQGKTNASLVASRSEMEYHLAREAREYLEGHLSENVTLEDLCRELHYGKSRISAVFRKQYGDSVMRFSLRTRLSRAAKDLRETADSVADVSARYGFDSPQYFSRIFRRYFGVSPRDWRRGEPSHQNH